MRPTFKLTAASAILLGICFATTSQAFTQPVMVENPISFPVYCTMTGTGGFVKADQGMPGSNTKPWFFSGTGTGGWIGVNQLAPAPDAAPWPFTSTRSGGFVLSDQGKPGPDATPWPFTATRSGGFTLADQGTPAPDAAPWPFTSTRSGGFVLSDQGKPGPDATPWPFSATRSGSFLLSDQGTPAPDTDPWPFTSTKSGGFVLSDQGTPGPDATPWPFTATRSGGFLLADQGAPGLLPWHVAGTVTIWSTAAAPIFVTNTASGGFVLSDQGKPGPDATPWPFTLTRSGGFTLADQGKPGPDATPWPFSATRSGSFLLSDQGTPAPDAAPWPFTSTRSGGFVLSDQGKPGPNTTPWFYSNTGSGTWIGADILNLGTSVYLDNDTQASVPIFRVESRGMLYNGSSWDRLRGDITNGLDVDVTRVQGLVNASGTVWPSSGALWGVAGDITQTGTLAGITATGYFVSGLAGVQHAGRALMTTNPTVHVGGPSSATDAFGIVGGFSANNAIALMMKTANAVGDGELFSASTAGPAWTLSIPYYNINNLTTTSAKYSRGSGTPFADGVAAFVALVADATGGGGMARLTTTTYFTSGITGVQHAGNALMTSNPSIRVVGTNGSTTESVTAVGGLSPSGASMSVLMGVGSTFGDGMNTGGLASQGPMWTAGIPMLAVNGGGISGNTAKFNRLSGTAFADGTAAFTSPALDVTGAGGLARWSATAFTFGSAGGVAAWVKLTTTVFTVNIGNPTPLSQADTNNLSTPANMGVTPFTGASAGNGLFVLNMGGDVSVSLLSVSVAVGNSGGATLLIEAGVRRVVILLDPELASTSTVYLGISTNSCARAGAKLAGAVRAGAEQVVIDNALGVATTIYLALTDGTPGGSLLAYVKKFAH